MREGNIKAVTVMEYPVGCLLFHNWLYKPIDVTCILVQDVENADIINRCQSFHAFVIHS